MKRILRIGIPAGLLLLAVWFFRSELEMEVITGESFQGNAIDAVTGTVEVFASADAMVQTEREGNVTEVLVKEGDLVEKGDVLLVLESKALDLELKMERYRLDAAERLLELPLTTSFDVLNREDQVNALKLQVELGQMSKNRLEEAERELEKMRAQEEEALIRREEQVGVLKTRVEQLEFDREKMQIKAPFKGEVVEVFSFVGSRLNRNNNTMRIVSPSRLIIMELSEEDFAGVEKGMPVTLRFASYPGREFRGEVNWIAKVANSKEKTRKLYVKLYEAGAEMVPGITGEGYLIRDERKDAVLVPRKALRGNRVYVVDSNGVIDIRTVKPGFLSLNNAEILEGLKVGETVVLEDQDMLSDGQHVRIKGMGTK